MKRNILITGGTGKVGTALIKNFINDGHFVVLTTRNLSKYKDWLITNNISESAIHVIEVDFNQPGAEVKIVNGLLNNIDVIIHNAREIETLKIDLEGSISKEQFQREFYLAVTFPYLLTQQLIKDNHPIKDVIFISSMYGVVAPNPKLYTNFELQSPINYGIAKAAQIHLTKELAVRLSNKSIRVNCISYGGIEGRVDDDFRQRYSLLNPMKRMLNETDLYPPIKMLLDAKELAITGENIKIDGGWTIW